MDRDQLQRVKSIIEKVKVFRGFNITEAQQLIKLCQPKSYQKGEIIYEIGTPSTEMFILLQGKLIAFNGVGTELGEILPGSTTGEMGVLTSFDRSARVVAAEDAAGFAIQKTQLDALMKSNDDIRTKVLENMVAVLSERVMSANTQIENYAEKARAL